MIVIVLFFMAALVVVMTGLDIVVEEYLFRNEEDDKDGDWTGV